MSVKVSSNVWEYCRQKGSAKLLMLLLADYASDDGSNAYPSYATMARKLNISERQAVNLINRLQDDGELRVTPRYDNNGRSTSNNYHLAPVYVHGEKWEGEMYFTLEGEVEFTHEGEASFTRSISKNHHKDNKPDALDTSHNHHSTDTLSVNDNAYGELHAAVCTATSKNPLLVTASEEETIQNLFNAGYTKSDIQRHYSDRTGYWWRGDWRGKKNQRPTVKTIAETIGVAVDWQPPQANGAGQSSKRDTVTTIKDLAKRYGARGYKDAEPELREAGLLPLVKQSGGWGHLCRMDAKTMEITLFTALQEVPA